MLTHKIIYINMIRVHMFFYMIEFMKLMVTCT